MENMTLFNTLSERDYSGSEADQYAQDLMTYFMQLSASGEASKFLELLQQAEDEGKKITLKEGSDDEYSDEITFEDLTLA